MSDPINRRLPDELERLATDIRIDRHGDPYLGFVVLLYPEEHGSVICVGFEDRSPMDMTRLRFKSESTMSKPGRDASLPTAELEHAREAIDDLCMALKIANDKREGSLADQVDRWMTDARDRRQMYGFTKDLERATYEAKNPAVCEFCTHRFTTRGIKRHESTCYKNPNAKQYGPNGDRDPIIHDGRIVGAQRRPGDERQCARCPEPGYLHFGNRGKCKLADCPCEEFTPIDAGQSVEASEKPSSDS